MVLPRPATAQSDALSRTLVALRASPVVLCIRMHDAALALSAASAALSGGLRVVEVAMTTPDAPSIIATLAARHPAALIGAGTVLTPADVAAARDAGARFALSPVLDPAIIDLCHAHGMLAVPGAATPTECHNAYQSGARLVKVFPINLYGGVQFVRAMQGPLGHIPLLPTSGIDAESLPTYLAAPNVAAVGASRQILAKEALARGDMEVIKQRAAIWAAIAAEHGGATS